VTGDSVNPSEGLGDTSSSLLDKIRAKDEKAWERFIHLYSPLVYKWCRQGDLQEADAADVGQEVFRSVAAAIGNFRHERDSDTLRGWLRTITRNKLNDFGRRKRNETQARGGSDAQEEFQQLPDEKLGEADETSIEEDNRLIYRRAVEMVLSECEETTRKAFMAYAVEQRPAADIAEELGITVNTVYLAKSRILRRLREEFGDIVVQK
jgi:RNA polymerase sigma-70 factor (ECF subfamily)